MPQQLPYDCATNVSEVETSAICQTRHICDFVFILRYDTLFSRDPTQVWLVSIGSAHWGSKIRFVALNIDRILSWQSLLDETYWWIEGNFGICSLKYFESMIIFTSRGDFLRGDYRPVEFGGQFRDRVVINLLIFFFLKDRRLLLQLLYLCYSCICFHLPGIRWRGSAVGTGKRKILLELGTVLQCMVRSPYGTKFNPVRLIIYEWFVSICETLSLTELSAWNNSYFCCISFG